MRTTRLKPDVRGLLAAWIVLAIMVPAGAFALSVDLDPEDTIQGDALQDNYWKWETNGDISGHNVLDEEGGDYISGSYCVTITYTEHGAKKSKTKTFKMEFKGGDCGGMSGIPPDATIDSVEVHDCE